MEGPSDLHKSLINEFNHIRGRILTSYSQIEFLLADLSVKLDLKFPYLIKNRIKAAKRIAERPGYESYKSEIESVCDDLLQYDEMRNFMAHGFVQLTTDRNGNHKFDLRLYQRGDSEGFYLETRDTTIPRLENAAEHITQFVDRAMSLFGRIYLDKRLEHSEE